MYTKAQLSRSKIREKYCNMLYRCYSENNHESHPWNKGCSVCDEWLDPEYGFERFAEWCEENFYVIEGESTVELDKDISVKGNKVYSPDTCLFVPKKINCMFGGSSKKSDDSLPKGVIYDPKKQMYYPVLYGIDGRLVTKKRYFDTPEEAWQEYAICRKDYINAVADAYRADIPDALYRALKNWVIEISDC